MTISQADIDEAILAALAKGPMTFAEIYQAAYRTLVQWRDDPDAPVLHPMDLHSALKANGCFIPEVVRGKMLWARSDGPHTRPEPKPRKATRKKSEPGTARKKDPHAKSVKREPVEILACMAGRSNFLTPTEGKSTATVGITPQDIAHAIAAGKSADGWHDDLGAAAALAWACQRANEWPTIRRMGYPKLLTELENQRKWPGILKDGAKFRALIVLRDAFAGLADPRQRKPIKDLAKAAEMDEHAYRFMHKTAVSMLEHRAANAARDACVYLFAPMAEPGQASLVLGSAERTRVIAGRDIDELVEQMIGIPAPQKPDSDDFAWLLNEIATSTHTRTLGVLRLRGEDYVAVLNTGDFERDCATSQKVVDSTRFSPENPHP